MEGQGLPIAGADRKHFNLQNAETAAGTGGEHRLGNFMEERELWVVKKDISGWTPLLVE